MSLAISSAAVARLAACSCGTCAACAPRPVMQAVSVPVAEPASRADGDRYEPSGQALPIINDRADTTDTADTTASDATSATADGSATQDGTAQRKRDATPTEDVADAPDSSAGSSSTRGRQELSDDERRMIAELQARDREVRSHEAAHQAAGGGYVGGASYSYQQGPDGRQYAIGGEVPVDMSTSGGSPEAVIAKMAQVRAAAMAPADPSAQDFAVAAAAAAIAAAARQEQRATQDSEAAEQTTTAVGEAQASTVVGGNESRPAERQQAGDDPAGNDARRESAGAEPRLPGETSGRGESATANGPATRAENDARPAGRAVNAYRAAQAGAGAASQIDQRA